MKPFTILAVVVFSLMCLVHILRLFYGWEVIVSGARIPVWASAVAAAVTGIIAYGLWKESRGSLDK